MARLYHVCYTGRMEEESAEDRRAHSRALTDLEVALTGDGGAVLDPEARALDVSPEGFRVVSHNLLKQGSRLSFAMSLEDGTPVSGEAEVVWSRPDGWGGCEAGLRITSMSWSDARRLRGQVYEPGFDFGKLAWLAAKVVFLLVIVAGVQNVLFHQPHMRSAAAQALPAVAVVLIVAVVVHALVKDS